MRGLILLLLFCLLTLPAHAQNYVPPPLFDPPQTIVKETPKEAKTAPVARPVTAPIIAPKPSSKPSIKPLSKKDIPPPPSTIKNTLTPTPRSQGVVTGPITMPSAPAKSVETEILFEPSAEDAPPLIQQRIDAAKEEKANQLANQPEEAPPLPAFKVIADNALQSTLYFVSHAEKISDANRKTIRHLIVPELANNQAKRILIQAYAAPQDGVLNGDRRIALSRALNVRKQLIEHNILPSRINVRAIGAQTNTQPLDRVELIIR